VQVTLLNFQASLCSPSNKTVLNCRTPTIPSLALNVSLPFIPTTVTSVTHGTVPFHYSPQVGDGETSGGAIIHLSLPLNYADFVLFE
jgi:hypothetical protein